MSNAVEIRRLAARDVEDFRSIRLAALQTAPEAFGSVHAIEASRAIDFFVDRLTTSVVFGAYAGGRIIGVIGFRRHDGAQEAHKGFVWGFYVEPGFRRAGVGAALLSALVALVRGVVEQMNLTVVDSNAAAIALYEGFGFLRYGLEERALKTAEGYRDEVLMVLFFDAP